MQNKIRRSPIAAIAGMMMAMVPGPLGSTQFTNPQRRKAAKRERSGQDRQAATDAMDKAEAKRIRKANRGW